MTDVTIRMPGLDWKTPIVSDNGIPSPYFQRFWQNISVKVQVGNVDVSGKVDSGTSTGWTPMIGASLKGGGLDVSTVTLPQLASIVKALIDAGLSSHLLN